MQDPHGVIVESERGWTWLLSSAILTQWLLSCLCWSEQSTAEPSDHHLRSTSNRSHSLARSESIFRLASAWPTCHCVQWTSANDLRLGLVKDRSLSSLSIGRFVCQVRWAFRSESRRGMYFQDMELRKTATQTLAITGPSKLRLLCTLSSQCRRDRRHCGLWQDHADMASREETWLSKGNPHCFFLSRRISHSRWSERWPITWDTSVTFPSILTGLDWRQSIVSERSKFGTPSRTKPVARKVGSRTAQLFSSWLIWIDRLRG